METIPLLGLARTALVLALVINVVTVLRLLPPVTPHDRTTIAVMTFLALLQGAAAVTVASRRRSARALVYLLGAFGTVVAGVHLTMLARGAPENPPLPVLVATLVQMLSMATAAVLAFLASGRPAGRRAA